MKRFLSALLAVFMIAALICVPAFAEGEGDATTYQGDTAITEATYDWFDYEAYTTNNSAKTNYTFYIDSYSDLLGWANLSRAETTNVTIGDTTINKNLTFEYLTVELTADININPNWVAGGFAEAKIDSETGVVSYTAATNAFPGINVLNGKFDGNGHTISGLYMYQGSHAHFGFIINMERRAEVRDLVFDNGLVVELAASSASGGRGVGGLVGRMHNTEVEDLIENVYFAADVLMIRNGAGNQMVGGLVGRLDGSQTAVDNGDGTYTTHANVVNCVYAGKVMVVGQTDMKPAAAFNASQMLGGGQADGSVAKITFTNCVSLGSLYIGQNDARYGTNYEAYGEGKVFFVNLIEGQYGKDATISFKVNSTMDSSADTNGFAPIARENADVADFVYSKVAGAVVPASVAAMLNHNAYAQTGTITVGEEQVKALRILTGLENLDWAEVAYTVTVGEKTETTDPITTVYKSVTAAGEVVAAGSLNANYEYLYGLVIQNIPDNCTLEVTPVVTTAKGTVVTLHSFTVVVDNGQVK